MFSCLTAQAWPEQGRSWQPAGHDRRQSARALAFL